MKSCKECKSEIWDPDNYLFCNYQCAFNNSTLKIGSFFGSGCRVKKSNYSKICLYNARKDKPYYVTLTQRKILHHNRIVITKGYCVISECGTKGCLEFNHLKVLSPKDLKEKIKEQKKRERERKMWEKERDISNKLRFSLVGWRNIYKKSSIPFIFEQQFMVRRNECDCWTENLSVIKCMPNKKTPCVEIMICVYSGLLSDENDVKYKDNKNHEWSKQSIIDKFQGFKIL